MDTQVVKRDGSKEAFDPEKIDRVAVAAGLTPDQSTELVNHIGEWLKNQNVPSISSLTLRDKVIEELTKVDSYAANMFTWYQKTKEKTS